MRDREPGYFPFSADGVEAPNTSGTVSSVPTGRETDIDNPARFVPPPVNQGAIVKGNIGNTDYIYALEIGHGVLAGDS